MYEESIIINFNEQSGATTPIDSARTTAMIIEANSGPIKPVLFQAGSESAIRAMFGDPSSTNPQVLGAILANRNSNLLISAPDTNGLADALWLTQSGLFSDTDSGVELGTLGTLATEVAQAGVPVTQLIGSGDDSTTVFSKIVAAMRRYDRESLKLKVGANDSVAPTKTTTVKTVTTYTFTGYTVTFDSSTNTVTIAADAAPVTGEDLSVIYTNPIPQNTKALFYARFTGPSKLSASITYDESQDQFTLDIYRQYSTGIQKVETNVFSLTEGAKNGFGVDIFAENIFANNPFIGCIVFNSNLDTGFNPPTTITSFLGEVRGAVDDNAITAGIDALSGMDNVRIDYFCDVTEKPAIYEAFQSFSLGNWPYSRYIIPVPAETTTAAEEWAKNNYKADPNFMAIDNRCIYSLAKYGGSNIELSATADIIYNLVLGATLFDAAPVAGYTDGYGFGGRLTGPIIGLKRVLKQNDRLNLSKLYINPVVQDSEEGYMMYSQKSGKKAVGVLDMVPVVGAVNYIKRNMVNALKKYVQKWNDAGLQSQASFEVETIISPMRVSKPEIVSGYEISVDNTVNTPTSLAQGELRIKVVVAFNNIVEKVVIYFTVTDTGVEVS